MFIVGKWIISDVKKSTLMLLHFKNKCCLGLFSKINNGIVQKQDTVGR